ncbi:hypothetical protein PYCCODRAFT_1436681 [Trametes coccinea BRFM310]|uniref:Uncharacterized protein n=1 Tax=Trametes coccinea (strain BRFM310) TaxID=1353009 RepID=A0A1Y2IJ48_TRAC3|nr:hypothetical protein PYCCODRAFT_1436681 [Trametes coccinea BRFM310]
MPPSTNHEPVPLFPNPISNAYPAHPSTHLESLPLEEPHHTNSHLAVVLGAVLGTITLVALIAAAVVPVLRRRRRRPQRSGALTGTRIDTPAGKQLCDRGKPRDDEGGSSATSVLALSARPCEGWESAGDSERGRAVASNVYVGKPC